MSAIPIKHLPRALRLNGLHLSRFVCLLLAVLWAGALLLGRAQAAPALQGPSTAGDLLITKYLDGAGNDKAIEIYNGTGSPKSLSLYRLEIYDEVSSNATVVQHTRLSDLITTPNKSSIDVGEALVIKHPAFTAINGFGWSGLVFDGGDAIVLRELATVQRIVVDSFGQTNSQPGGAWSANGVSTKGTSLQRKRTVCRGRTSTTSAFDPSLEWEPIPGNPYALLGRHQLDCPVATTNLLINEFVFDHVGDDTHEFIEVKVDRANTYDRYSVVVVDGNGFIIYSRRILDSEITGDGYWTTPFLQNQVGNATATILLVRNYQPPAGSSLDIDVNNDGVIDTTFWDAVINDVGIRVVDGDRTYAALSGITLARGFDGVDSAPGGASRLPDGQTSGPFGSWVRNHFDGQGLGCSGCATGGASTQVAVNTPRRRNEPGAGGPVTPVVTPTFTTTPTPTVTRTPLPGRTPLPTNCKDIIANGDFEENHIGWTFGEDPVPPRYSADQRRFGLRSVLLGNPPDTGSPNAVSYSSVRQLVSIPMGATVAYLTWSHLSLTQETPRDPTGQTDRQEFIPLAPNQMPISIKYRTLINESNWRDERRDLTDLIGKNFYIYFNVYNDGSALRTWMYLDNVQLVICHPDGMKWEEMGKPMWPNQGGDKGSGMVTPTPMPLPTAGPAPTAAVQPAAQPVAEAPTALPVCTPPPCPGGELLCSADNCLNSCGMVCMPAATLAPVSAAAPIELPPQTNSVARQAAETQQLPGCKELVVNGDFESSGLGWATAPTDLSTGYTTAETFNGSGQAMQIGSLQESNLPSINMVEQTVAVPSNYANIRLEFRFFPQQSAAPGPGDRQYVDIYNAISDQFETRVMSEQRGDRVWLLVQSDLNDLRGKQVKLRFAVNNDGVSGRSAMIVDNVSILACDPTGEADQQELVLVQSGGVQDTSSEAKPSTTQTDIQVDASGAQLGRVNAALGRLGTIAVLVGILVAIALLAWALMQLWRGLSLVFPILLLVAGLLALAWLLFTWGMSAGTIGVIMLVLLLMIAAIFLIRQFFR